MLVLSLQSGSNGNSIYVESKGVRLLLDAGISGVQAAERLERFGRDIRGVDAVVVSHDHVDHCRSIGIFQRKFGLPIHATEETLLTAQARHRLGRLDCVHPFEAGSTLRFGEVSVETIPTPHDGVDGVALIVDDGDCRLGILTDLGHVFQGLPEAVASLDAILLESNYDAQMLANGPYPPFLQHRIRGPGGHLSNLEAAELLAIAGTRLRWACLGHLSEHNNHPNLALATHRDVLGNRFPLHVASRYEPTGMLEV